MESEIKICNYLKIQNVLSVIPTFSNHIVLTGSPILINQSFTQLFFQFQIKPLQSIRLNGDNNKKLIKLTLGDIHLSVKVCRQQNEFLYEEGLYRNNLVAELVFGKESMQIGMKQIKIGQWTSLLIVIQKNIYLNNQKKCTLQNCVPVLEIGSMQKNKVFESKLKGIILTNKKQSTPTQENIKKQNIIYDGPLDTIPKTQVPNINTLPEYSSPSQKEDKLYLCHDMEGGYQQDMNIFESYPQQKTSYSTYLHKNTYRSIHLPQASIFNYFSHHLVTIPPEHWRRMCKKSNTLCLGTYIIEHEKPTQEQYLSDYAIKMLVYFCRKYQFDGYLINFEHQIKKPLRIQPWLQKLVFQIHKVVPGSQIIWYDSVVPNGMIRYQNQLNENNSLFYRICDGIFLNYWWNPQKLKISLKHAIKNKPIYVGSDCFGRGTYMGGKYDTYKAMKTIKEVDNGNYSLFPALFAMGYTHEMEKLNIELWKLNEKCLYSGLKLKKNEIKNEAWSSVNVRDWISEGQWSVSMTGHRIRKAVIKLKKVFNQKLKNNVVASFVTSVSGSFPNYQDRYKVSIELKFQDMSLNVVTTDWKTASQNIDIVQLKTDVDADLITQQLLLVVTQQSISAQNWEGYLGARYKGDGLYLSFFQKQNDWISSVKTNSPQGVNLPYFTNYNLGHGEFFYFQGAKIKKCYDFLSDNDLCLTYLMNPPINVNIYHKDAYMGGTSLQISNTNMIKLIQVRTNKVKSLKCRVVVKCLNDKISYQLCFGNEKDDKKIRAQKGEKKQLSNNWEQINFQIELYQCNGQKIILYLESDKSINYLIGETAVYSDDEKDENKIESLRLQVSEHNPPIAPIFFDIYMQMSRQSRVIIKLDDQFASFGYADQLNSNRVIIKNVNSKLKKKQSNLVIYTLDSHLNLKSIFSQIIEYGKLSYQQSIVLI